VAKARPASEYIAEITVPNDGVTPVRQARAHSRDKLGILAMYLPAFAKACQRAGKFYFVDGLAGPGLYEFSDADIYVLGSTPIALRVDNPSFTKCIAMDLRNHNVAALQHRTAGYGDRAVVRHGDVNTDLLPLLEREVDPNFPILAFLDPEGIELEWQTVLRVARFREGKRKTELLVLVPTSSIGRVESVAPDRTAEGATRLDFMFPGNVWTEIMERRNREEITAEEARSALADEYCVALKNQGYASVRARPITRGAPDAPSVYHLVHATDSEAGERMYSNAPGDHETSTDRISPQLPLL